jgi:hypothetical protein
MGLKRNGELLKSDAWQLFGQLRRWFCLFRMVPSVAFGENSGIGFGRFLLSVSARFC